jgi:hemerythrin-like metal-binding protein
MKFIPIWHPGLSVLNPQLDAQHITLIEVGHELVRVNDSRRGTDEQIAHLLKDLSSILIAHHALEEAVLEKNDCPSLCEIKTFHLASRAMLNKLIEDARDHSIDRLGLPDKVAEWMTIHLIDTDMPVKKYLKK